MPDCREEDARSPNRRGANIDFSGISATLRVRVEFFHTSGGYSVENATVEDDTVHIVEQPSRQQRHHIDQVVEGL